MLKNFNDNTYTKSFLHFKNVLKFVQVCISSCFFNLYMNNLKTMVGLLQSFRMLEEVMSIFGRNTWEKNDNATCIFAIVYTGKWLLHDLQIRRSQTTFGTPLHPFRENPSYFRDHINNFFIFHQDLYSKCKKFSCFVSVHSITFT